MRSARLDREPTSTQYVPIESSPDVAASLIERVHQTARLIVLFDASHHAELCTDPYTAEHCVRSVLALPIVRGARLVGVLYLENNLATRAFTPDRVWLLQLLSSQIATSLENSQLFERLTREIEDRKRAEAGTKLAESLDYHATVKQSARLVVPMLADWCVVELLKTAKSVRLRVPISMLQSKRCSRSQGNAGWVRLCASM